MLYIIWYTYQVYCFPLQNRRPASHLLVIHHVTAQTDSGCAEVTRQQKSYYWIGCRLYERRYTRQDKVTLPNLSHGVLK